MDFDALSNCVFGGDVMLHPLHIIMLKDRGNRLILRFFRVPRCTIVLSLRATIFFIKRVTLPPSDDVSIPSDQAPPQDPRPAIRLRALPVR